MWTTLASCQRTTTSESVCASATCTTSIRSPSSSMAIVFENVTTGSAAGAAAGTFVE